MTATLTLTSSTYSPTVAEPSGWRAAWIVGISLAHDCTWSLATGVIGRSSATVGSATAADGAVSGSCPEAPTELARRAFSFDTRRSFFSVRRCSLASALSAFFVSCVTLRHAHGTSNQKTACKGPLTASRPENYW